MGFLLIGKRVEPPVALEVALQRQVREQGAEEGDRHAVLAQHRVVERPVGHATGGDQSAVERADLQAADQVGALVQRVVIAAEGAAHFGQGVVALVTDIVHEQLHALRRRHLSQVEAEREEDASAAVQAPEQHPDPVLRRPREAEVPEKHLPVESPETAVPPTPRATR